MSPRNVLVSWEGGVKLIDFDDCGTGHRLYEVAVGRDEACHVSGLLGEGVDVAAAPYNEAGVAYSPDGVLFLAQATVNNVGQLAAGSTVTDKTVNVAALGHAPTACGVNFVPAGFPGAGLLYLMTTSRP